MVGIFETTFQHASSTPLPPNLSIEAGIAALHDFEGVIRMNPDCRGCKPITPPVQSAQPQMQYYEVEDDLPFIPKRLWSGGVKYNADFLPTTDGCDITVYAPGGFTSTNHWRLLRDSIPEHAEETHTFDPQTKDLSHMHSETGSAGWHVQILSDARCPKAFAGFVKGFLKNSHIQLEQAFIDKLTEISATLAQKPDVAAPLRPQQRERRPTLGRRRSSIL